MFLKTLYIQRVTLFVHARYSALEGTMYRA